MGASLLEEKLLKNYSQKLVDSMKYCGLSIKNVQITGDKIGASTDILSTINSVSFAHEKKIEFEKFAWEKPFVVIKGTLVRYVSVCT